MPSSWPELRPGSVASESELGRIALDECGKLGWGRELRRGKRGTISLSPYCYPTMASLLFYVRACAQAT